MLGAADGERWRRRPRELGGVLQAQRMPEVLARLLLSVVVVIIALVTVSVDARGVAHLPFINVFKRNCRGKNVVAGALALRQGDAGTRIEKEVFLGGACKIGHCRTETTCG